MDEIHMFTLNSISSPLLFYNFNSKLTPLVYEIDDILDECATHAAKLNHNHNKLTRYSLKKILDRHKIARRMKQVTDKLDVAAERAKFHLREMPVDRPREAAAARETGSLLNESEQIFGREKDKEEIVKMLVDDAREKEEMPILPIIGVGGLGKTTLAQQVYNDPRVVEHFERRVWVCVSDNFDIKTLVKAMIESGTGSGKDSDLQHLDALERRLWELLSKRRYLLVLDDVWNDHQHKWFELRDTLSCGSTGSSIVVTTRQKKVADIMGTLPAHCLKELSDEHCWMLFRQRAFGQNEDDACRKLEVIGKQIVKKCVGVPLAAKALGGILRFKRTAEEWMYVRDNEMWNLQQEESLILPALKLSYHHLPLQLRQCFAYFAAFPKDHQIQQHELVQLWIAHGYISSQGKLEAEDVGNEICNELVLRSLLQHRLALSDDVQERLDISMHDLVHDLAQSIMENKVPGRQFERNVVASTASTLREVNLRHKTVFFPKSFHQDMDISSILENKSLRVLNASFTKIKDLPPSIGKLKHLRTLNLSRTEIRTLPNSLCTLWNLQILNLDNCYKLEALPKNTRYLHNLRHLCLENCVSLSEMPPGIRELSQLKTLSRFVVGLNRSNQLEELQCLNLYGRLELCHLARVKNHLDAKKANIAEKNNLRELMLWWNRDSECKLVEDVDEKVLEELQPQPNLESLRIQGFGGRYLPFWMASSTLGKITQIEIVNCQNCKCLPKLGELPLLETLRLQNLGVDYIINEDEVQHENLVRIKFPCLKYLYLHHLPNLKGVSKEEESIEAFPNLTTLGIDDCSSLILSSLSFLQNLEVLTCSSSTLAVLPELHSLITLNVDIEEKLTCFPVAMLVKFTKLFWLKLHGAKEISVTREAVQSLNKVQVLTVSECLPKGLLEHFTGLTFLVIGVARNW